MELDSINPYVLKVMPSAMRKFDHDISSDPKIIKLTLGEPNFNVPDHIKQAAIDAINHNESHYPYYWGYQPLREAASTYYQAKFGYHYSADQILVTVGATEAVASAVKTLFKPGDAVIIPTPAYPLYNALTTLNELNTILVDTSDDGFILTPAKVNQAIADHPDWDVKGLILTDPNNPTGVAYTEEQINALAPVLKKNGIWVISDEIYGELTYGQKHYSISKVLPDQTVVINGLSKSHAMTGYRLGLVFGPSGFIDEIAKVHQYTVTAAASIVQYAAIEALTHGQDDSKPMLKEYQKRRDFVAKEMAEAGFGVVHPGGAFYVFAKIPADLQMNSWDFVNTLAKEYHIGLMPGDPFGDNEYVRISYAASDEALAAAMKAVKQLVADHSAQTTE
ncbi:aminotransferase class I/II-fold pyridoxal phosphate-dependent enzyme [Lentilactobacillus buchneri]|uniref:Aminotransferase n=1 Tax=Lentilactobacillus buchneri DSM 20057 TaxID=1423728 RepID=A0A4R5NSK9_LENBU|nr:aminotransferase class I/II-fold pyridoxal phosphate-dependent enzyme [Lentilactobacillus buchneri]WCJ52688.1 aminotransferase class I/II-fold pyridoxal phosphate-dependent enzyme [Lentilactobacillus sp. Egmn17]AEB72451.1 Aspartate transaminase [Lentilactobacillus buchneri NRRL B-30929]KRK68541.1 aspartate transaminase [Lentilactobacillus buchneri DSM 20057]MCT2881617.1 aminotransferase class I/II-fold pyridoxal phosphate-dependent enzyme [Lentilactobacillus buchneri]MCT2898023.1 aminotrans